MLDYLIEENELMTHFQEYHLGKGDVHFIKKLIRGRPSSVCCKYRWM